MKKPVQKKARKKPRPSRRKAKMTDKPRAWPSRAAESRDRSAEEAVVIVKSATDALEMTNDPSLLKKIARILASANNILRHMESQGAKTRPQ
jgi:hypothetical protein